MDAYIAFLVCGALVGVLIAAMFGKFGRRNSFVFFLLGCGIVYAWLHNAGFQFPQITLRDVFQFFGRK